MTQCRSTHGFILKTQCSTAYKTGIKKDTGNSDNVLSCFHILSTWYYADHVHIVHPFFWRQKILYLIQFYN